MKQSKALVWGDRIQAAKFFGGGAILVLLGGCVVVTDESGGVGIDEQRLRAAGGAEIDANELVIAAPSSATTCKDNTQCSTGYCVDGFCCDHPCDNSCMACSAAKKGSGADGFCGSIVYEADPDDECPNGACDGGNLCKDYNSNPCSRASDCLSNYCVDGFCCNNICLGACQACSAAKKGSGDDGVCGNIVNDTDPDNECILGGCNGSGACTWVTQPTFPNGASCVSAAQCDSGYCADGICCDSYCLGSCQACTAVKKNEGVDGVCGPIANEIDPDEECWGGACNGLGACKHYNGLPCSNKNECLSGFCVDGVCCGNLCTQSCYACSEDKKGQGLDGVCEPIVAGRDVENECTPGECNGSGACSQRQTLRTNGTSCISDGQCVSGNCTDGVCCDATCRGSCQACTAAIKGHGVDGVCGNISAESDPDVECNGGKCDGAGRCRFYNGVPCGASEQCFSTYCVDGFCCGNVCTSACYACSADKKGEGLDGVCEPIVKGDDPDQECSFGTCNGEGACTKLLNDGTTCDVDSECASNHCADGVCCNTACTGTCLACNLVGTLGICLSIQLGIGDPNADTPCLTICNGIGICVTP